MNGRRLARYACTAAVLAACLLIPASATAVNSVVLRGFGTATVDGAMAPGEWDPAGRGDFSINRSPAEGGGTAPATIYVMNDGVNLYLGLKVANASVGTSELAVQFGASTQEGSDYLLVDRAGNFVDMFTHQVSPNAWQAVRDIDYGGTNDGDEWEGDASGYSFYELSHPLNDTDDAHDFSLRPPQRPAFDVSFRHCSTGNSCAAMSYFPSRTSQADIVVVSGSRVPPDTQLTAAPAEGSMVADPNAEFAFTGSDDVLQPAELTFECKADEDDWRPCTSPSLSGADDGRHTYSVRAVDEMLNVDPSPSQRTWVTDTTGPSRPVIRGRRSVRKGQAIVLRFSASDEFTPRSAIRFKCAVDSTRLRRCPAVFRARLRPGRHVVRVRAVDRLGNQGDLAAFRIRVKRASR